MNLFDKIVRRFKRLLRSTIEFITKPEDPEIRRNMAQKLRMNIILLMMILYL